MTSEGLMATQRNWSDLPAELLDIIFSSKLSSFVDVLNIKQVCTSWRRVIAEIKNPKKFRQLVFCPTRDIIKESWFLSIEDHKPYTLFKKSLRNGHSECLPYFIGSYHDGWVIVLNINEEIRICNLITDISILVPKYLCTLGYTNARGTLSHDPCSHRDFVVAILNRFEQGYGNHMDGEINFWRHGDKEWSSLHTCEFVEFIDIAFNKYTLCALMYGDPYTIETWDFEQDLPAKKMIVELSCVTPFTFCHCPWSDHDGNLVLLPSGEIFIALNPNKWLDCNRRWKLMKVDLGKKICQELKSLDGGALLYGHNNSILVSSIDVQRHGYSPDSIYYVYHHWDGTNKLMRYSLEDEETLEIQTLGTQPTENERCWCWMDITTTIYSC